MWKPIPHNGPIMYQIKLEKATNSPIFISLSMTIHPPVPIRIIMQRLANSSMTGK
ncbi:hypothetical protein D3C71_2143720 [compost metagenome]